jgi:hypothetical protein
MEINQSKKKGGLQIENTINTLQLIYILSICFIHSQGSSEPISGKSNAHLYEKQIHLIKPPVSGDGTTGRNMMIINIDIHRRPKGQLVTTCKTDTRFHEHSDDHILLREQPKIDMSAVRIQNTKPALPSTPLSSKCQRLLTSRIIMFQPRVPIMTRKSAMPSATTHVASTPPLTVPWRWMRH